MQDQAIANYSNKRFLFVIGAVLLATGFVYCKPWKNRSPEERADVIAKRMTKELELNQAQIATLEKIKEEVLARHKAGKAERDAQFKAMTELVRAPTIDRAKLAALKARHDAQRDADEDLFLDKVVELHKVLTPDQRVKAAEALLKYEKKFSGEK